MGDKRMFTKKVTDDDHFMNLSASAQALYLHLMMSSDDDGFSNQVSLSMFKAHASVQDLEALLSNRYIYQFENGVIVIKHFRMANALRKDRYTPTVFQEELSHLELKKNGAYTWKDDMVASWLPNGCQEVALSKDKLSKDKLSKDITPPLSPSGEKSTKKQETKNTYGTYENVKLTFEEFDKLREEFGEQETLKTIEFFSSYIAEKGYKSKSHYLAMRRWVFDAAKEAEARSMKNQQPVF